MLNRFNHLVTDQFNNRTNFIVPNHLVNLGDYQSARSRENMFISNEVERKRWLDEKLANIEANESRKYDEQCARQAETDRETVRMIKELEEYDKARRLRQDISDKTEIQDGNNASYHLNEKADTYDSRTMVDDSGLYKANALPYKPGGVQLGIWRGGSPSQYVTFASDLLQPKGAGDVLTGEGSYMRFVFQNRGNHQYSEGGTVAPGVGIDNVEEYGLFARKFTEDNKEEIENLVNEIGRSTARVLGDAFKSKLISKLPIPIEMKLPVHILIFLYCAYQCAQSAYEKEVVPYMREHNCSVEEAAENTAVERAFFAEFGKLLLTTYVGMVASTFDISERTQLMIDALVGEVVERIFG